MWTAARRFTPGATCFGVIKLSASTLGGLIGPVDSENSFKTRRKKISFRVNRQKTSKNGTFGIFDPFYSCFGILSWSEVKINHTTWFSSLDLVSKRCDWKKIPQKIFPQNLNFCHFGQILKFWAKIFCGIFLQSHLFLTKSRPENHVVFILTSDHHKMPKQ